MCELSILKNEDLESRGPGPHKLLALICANYSRKCASWSCIDKSHGNFEREVSFIVNLWCLIFNFYAVSLQSTRKIA